MAKFQAPELILRGWAIETFRRVLTRTLGSAEEVTDAYLKSKIPRMTEMVNILAEEESYLNEPSLTQLNMFLQDGAIQIRLTGETPDGESRWVQHSFPIKEMVRIR